MSAENLLREWLFVYEHDHEGTRADEVAVATREFLGSFLGSVEASPEPRDLTDAEIAEMQQAVNAWDLDSLNGTKFSAKYEALRAEILARRASPEPPRRIEQMRLFIEEFSEMHPKMWAQRETMQEFQNRVLAFQRAASQEERHT